MPGRKPPNERRLPPTLAVLLPLLWGGWLAAPSAQGSSGSSVEPLEGFRRAVAEAESGLALGEMQLGESRYRQALFEGWLTLGSLREATGELEAARADYRRAADSVVRHRSALVALALAEARSGRPDEAELHLRSLIADDPADHEARRLLSRVLADAGRLEAAVQELEQLRYLTPGNSEHAYQLATAYLRQERVGEAAELLAELAEAIPASETWVLIGRTYRDAEQYERARAALARALEMDPKARRAHYYLGTIELLEQGQERLEPAIDEFDAELDEYPDEPMTHLFRGMALSELRRYEEAIPSLEKASALRSVRADALRFLGRSLIAAGRREEGVLALRNGLEAAEEDAGADPNAAPEFAARQISSLHYQLGQALRAEGEREEAEAHFEAAKRFHARSSEGARESLDRYLSDETEASPLSGAPSPRVQSWSELPSEDLAEVERQLSTALARVYLNLGVLKSRASRLPEAIDLFEQAERLDSNLEGLQFALGAARFAAGRYLDAAPALERSQEAEPSTEGKRMLAMAWLNAEEYAKAAALLSEDPAREANPQLQYAYGLALVRSGRPEEAEAVFGRLVATNAEWPELNVVLGQAYAQQGDYPSAIATLQRALTLDPQVAEGHATLGEIYLRRGELDAAEEELRAELRSHPADARSAYTLATVLDLNQKPEEATSLLRSLLERHPELAKGRYLLGKILLAGGAPEDAAEQLEAAVGLAPSDPAVHYQLGLAYRELGRRAESQRAFERYRALKQEDEG